MYFDSYLLFLLSLDIKVLNLILLNPLFQVYLDAEFLAVIDGKAVTEKVSS